MTGEGRHASGGLPGTVGGGDQAGSFVADRELLARLRAGEDAAFGEVFARHSDAVRRLAARLAHDRAEADDLTAEAFFRVLQAIRRGSGPVDNVRAYLLIVARRVAIEWNLRRRDVPVTDEELDHRVGHDLDHSGRSYERNLIARAFNTLPERWRVVLWHVEVEGERPAEVAASFGLSPNATAALAKRARQGLRAAYLQAHLAADRGPTGCRSVLEKLGGYTAGNVKGAERRKIRAHLGDCASCRSTHAELRDVCAGLRAHAGLLLVAAPLAAAVDHLVTPATLAGAGGTGSVAGAGGLGFGGLGAAAKVAVTATSAAVFGAVGLTLGPVVDDLPPVQSYAIDGDRGMRLVITGPSSAPPNSTAVPRTGSLSSYFFVPRAAGGEGEAAPAVVGAGPHAGGHSDEDSRADRGKNIGEDTDKAGLAERSGDRLPDASGRGPVPESDPVPDPVPGGTSASSDASTVLDEGEASTPLSESSPGRPSKPPSTTALVGDGPGKGVGPTQSDQSDPEGAGSSSTFTPAG